MSRHYEKTIFNTSYKSFTSESDVLFLNDIDFWSIHFTCGPRGGLVQGWESTWHFSWPCATSLDAWAMSLLNVLMNNNNDSWIKFILFSKLQSFKSFKTSHFQQDCYQKQRNGKTHMSGVFKIWVSRLSPHDMFTNYFRSDDCASMWLQRSVDGDSWILWNQWTRINVSECNAIRCLSLMLQCSLPPMAQGC